MKNLYQSLLVKTALALALVGVLVSAQAADTTTADGAAKSKPAVSSRANHYPIHGKLAAVDKAAGTFTIKGAAKDHVYQINAQTKITKGDGAPAILADAVIGEDVGGYVEKLPDGSVLAVSVRFGAKVAGDTKMPAKADANVEKPAKKTISAAVEPPMVASTSAADTMTKTNGVAKKVKKVKKLVQPGTTNSVPAK